MLEALIIALERWGVTALFGWVASLFRRTPQKDMEKAHEVENTVAGKSDAAVDSELRSKWER